MNVDTGDFNLALERQKAEILGVFNHATDEIKDLMIKLYGAETSSLGQMLTTRKNELKAIGKKSGYVSE